MTIQDDLKLYFSRMDEKHPGLPISDVRVDGQQGVCRKNYNFNGLDQKNIEIYKEVQKECQTDDFYTEFGAKTDLQQLLLVNQNMNINKNLGKFINFPSSIIHGYYSNFVGVNSKCYSKLDDIFSIKDKHQEIVTYSNTIMVLTVIGFMCSIYSDLIVSWAYVFSY